MAGIPILLTQGNIFPSSPFSMDVSFLPGSIVLMEDGAIVAESKLPNLYPLSVDSVVLADPGEFTFVSATVDGVVQTLPFLVTQNTIVTFNFARTSTAPDGIRFFATVTVNSFAPSDLAGLLAWYETDVGLVNEGGFAASWANQTGGDPNKNMANVPGRRPTIIDSDPMYKAQPSINGVNFPWLEGPGDWIVPGVQPLTVYAVGMTNALLIAGKFPLASRAVIQVAGGPWAMDAGITLSSAYGATFSPQASCAIFNGAASQLFVDEFVTPKVTGNAGTGSQARSAIFAYVGGSFASQASIGLYTIYSGIHNAGDRAKMRTYIKRKYGA